MKTKSPRHCKYIVHIYNKDMPDEELIADIRKTAKKLKKDYITMNEYAAYGKYHATTIYSRFGGWNPAITLAGLTVQRNRKVTHDELMLNIKKVWDSLGRQPKHVEMKRPLSVYGKGIYGNRYGSWLSTLDEFIKFMNRGNEKRAAYAAQKIFHNQKIKITPRKFRLRRKKKKLKLAKTIHAGLRFKIFGRDNFKCRACGCSPATDPKVILHVDHIIPRAKGGETTLNNLQTLCDKCNLGKGTS